MRKFKPEVGQYRIISKFVIRKRIGREIRCFERALIVQRYTQFRSNSPEFDGVTAWQDEEWFDSFVLRTYKHAQWPLLLEVDGKEIVQVNDADCFPLNENFRIVGVNAITGEYPIAQRRKTMVDVA